MESDEHLSARLRNYSEHFRGRDVAEAYELLYEPGQYDQVLWQIEREFLFRLLQENASYWPACSYLDFACGTGRVLAAIESKVASSTGVDVSDAMLRIAAQKVRQSRLACADITTPPQPGERYDLITAFRFFLNANPSQRGSVMKALAARLRNRHSLLVFTNHGNLFSYKLLLWPYHRLRRVGRPHPTVGNYLTHAQVIELLAEAGLEVVTRFGCGFISPHVYRFAPRLFGNVEQMFAGKQWVSRFGVDQIYAVRKPE